MDGEQKKGMSKGCLIGLIVAGALVVIIIIGGITCWVYKDDLAKMGVVTIVNRVKTQISENPVEGVDTVQFNAVTDAFLDKFNESELDLEKYSTLIQQFQGFMSNKEISADDVETMQELMIDYYPDLEEMVPPVEIPDTVLIEDTLSTE